MDSELRQLPTDTLGWEKWGYWIVNIFTFGSLWMLKVAIKKALIESTPESTVKAPLLSQQ